MLRPGTFALTLLLAALTALGPLSIDMYLPSLPDIAHVLGAPQARVQLTVSYYLVGFAVGQIFYGPLSDRYGRRPVLLAALAIYVTGTGVCALAQSIDPLLGARFLQGVGGAGSIVLARAIVRDLYAGVRAARELSLMGSISAFAPIVAPMIGGVLQIAFGWRASFILMGLAAIVATALAARLLPETLGKRSSEPFSLPFLFKSYGAVLRHRGFLAYLGIISVSFAGLFAWISGGAVVLEEVYGFSPVKFGFTFSLGAAGYMVGATIASRLVVRLGLDRHDGARGGSNRVRRPGLRSGSRRARRRYLAGDRDGGLSRRDGARDSAGHGRSPDAVSRSRGDGSLADGPGAANSRRCRGRRRRRLSRPFGVAGRWSCGFDELPDLPYLALYAPPSRAPGRRRTDVNRGFACDIMFV